MDFQYSFKYSKIDSIYLKQYKRVQFACFSQKSASIALEGYKAPGITPNNYSGDTK